MHLVVQYMIVRFFHILTLASAVYALTLLIQLIGGLLP